MSSTSRSSSAARPHAAPRSPAAPAWRSPTPCRTGASTRRVPAADHEIITRLEIEGGFASAQAPFAIIDSALRHAEGRTIDEHRDEIAQLWAGFNAVAAGLPARRVPEPRTAASIRDPSTANRPLAFPYNKWHCAQMNVDQAAAILICSADAAAGSASPASGSCSRSSRWSRASPCRSRSGADIHRWPAWRCSARGRGAPRVRLRDVDLVEVYSCFPAAVRVQQRALGLPLDGVPTITGGETFAGGPWNNFVLQTTAAMVDRLRAEPGANGLVTTVSGLLNKPGLAVYSTPPGELLLDDLAEANEREAATKEVVGGYQGPATVVAYTVHYDGTDPSAAPQSSTPPTARAASRRPTTRRSRRPRRARS